MPPEQDRERHRAKVTRKIVEILDQENGNRVENSAFILHSGNVRVEELISYNQLLEHLETAQEKLYGYGSGTFYAQSHHWTPKSFGCIRSRLKEQQKQCSSGVGD